MRQRPPCAAVLDVFLKVILPVLIVAGLGGWIGRRAAVPVNSLSQLTFYLFSPALVFDSLASVELSGGEAVRIVAVVLLGFLATLAISFTAAAVLRLDRPTTAAMALSSTITNGGNMGLPVALLAFGQAGLAVAVVAFVTGAVLAYSAGVVLASLGSQGVRTALSAPLRVPALWMAAAGLVVNMVDLNVPSTIDAVASTLAGASIPTMLVVLGLQLQQRIDFGEARELVAAVGTRLLIGPAAALGASYLLDVDGVTRHTLVVLGGMPTAVITTILATQYGARVSFVTRSVIVSSLVSIPTLTVLIWLLDGSPG